MTNSNETIFKIKIQCTHNWQLNYCGKNIKRNLIYNEIDKGVIFSNIKDSYIDKILIVHKSYKKQTSKTLEFFTFSLVSESDFTRFIYTLHLNGFQSESANTLIQFISTTTNKVIYNYSFNEIQEVPIPEIIRKKNKSKYNTEICYSTTQH
jgi:hypothetical protein